MIPSRSQTMTKYILRALFLFVTIISFFQPVSAAQQYVSRDRLIFLSEQFAQEVLHSDKDVKTIQDVGKKDTPDSVVYRTLRSFGRSMFEKGEQTKAFQYFRQALDILDTSEQLSTEALNFKSYCYLMLGAAMDEVGMHQLSTDYCLKGLKICEELNNHKDIAKFYNNLGVSCLRANDIKKAEDYFKKALEINTRYQENLEMSINYSNLSEIEGMRNDFDAAIEYALKAIQCLDERVNPFDYYSMQSTIGIFYTKKKEIHMARSWLENAYRHQKERNYKSGLFYTCLALMELEDVTGNRGGFEKYRDEAQSLAIQSGSSLLLNEFYKTTGLYYRSKGDYEKAYLYARKYIANQDSAYLAENKSRMEQTLNLFNLEKKTKEYESSIENWNPLWVLLICGSIAILLLGLLLWVIIVMRRAEKVRREKDRTDAMLSELREKHLLEEIKRNETTARELEDNRRSLAAVTLEKIKTNQTIDEVITDVRQILLSISTRDKENQTRLKTIVSKLAGMNNEVNWDEFQLYFAKVHPEYYHRLDEAHPGLTPKDRRLCALISLGLSTKEIAALTFREVRSVETSRNRLRKKLEIASDVNLEDYLLKFTTPIETNSKGDENRI